MWTEERVEILKKLWAAGFSASQIAGKLEGKTRNAVIGKVHRLGLSGRAVIHRKVSKPYNKSKKRIPISPKSFLPRPPFKLYLVQNVLQFPQVEELDIQVSENKSVETLLDSSCRWPIGDPQNVDFHFCGKNKVEGFPYCGAHVREAFIPNSSKRSKRKVGQV